MKPVRQLIRVQHGSHLYGTSIPTSDTDYKGVHLPSGESIILGRAENVINRNVVSKIEGTAKNASDAIDEQSYSLQKFFDMLMKGDTVATEILFAPVPEDADPLWYEVQTVGKLLLNRQIKGFVGYCIRQAAKYGIKGSRMAAVKKLLDFLDSECQSGGHALKLGDIEHDLRTLSEGQEHMEWENIPSPNDTDLWHINCCDRKMPMTASVNAARDVYQKVWDNYGERARQAMANEGIDWKAMSHAVRVAQQAIELLRTGKITFPRPNADVLLKIKQGQVPYSEVSTQLETLVARVQHESETSTLPEKSNHKAADALVRRLYLEQVMG